MEFIDFKKSEKSDKIDLLFPGWQANEVVAFLSPHDDDVLLGAGYLLSATVTKKGIPFLLVFCSGDAGYSTPEEKKTIVGRRKKETLEAYGTLGVQEENIVFFDVSDFSLQLYVNRDFPQGKGLFEEQVRLFREKKISRVVFSSGHCEHWDHSAVYDMGIYTSPQAGDPILADIGPPFRAKSHYIYSVWGDFAPPVSESDKIRADKGILVDANTENTIREAIKSFESQRKIFENIVSCREKRKSDYGYLELYQSAAIRKQTDFQAYIDLLSKFGED
ncbi:MAG: PIG-L family deacetylase [Candidatus Aminicenantes bacterium]|jgi:LmbE family N-acetylglucosaminyl deacetylase